MVTESVKPYSVEDFWHGWWRLMWHWDEKSRFNITWPKRHSYIWSDGTDECGNWYCGIVVGRLWLTFSCESFNQWRKRWDEICAMKP